MPAQFIGQIQGEGHSKRGGNRKSPHYHNSSHGFASNFISESISNNLDHLSTDHAAENTCKDACRKKEFISGSQAASECSDQKQGVGPEQYFFMVIVIHKKGSRKAKNPRTDGIS